MGVSDSPALNTLSKEGSGPKSVVSDGRGSLRNRKRTPVILERWFRAQEARTDVLGSGEGEAASGGYSEGDKED